MTKRNIRNYDDEFKNNAESLYLSGERSYPQLGEELGIAPSTLAGWVNSGKYGFLVHPKLSYVSTDLLANLNNSPKAICAAKMLTGKEVASLLQKEMVIFHRMEMIKMWTIQF